MEFSRQEYWSGLPFPSPGHLPDPGIVPGSPGLQADSLPLSHQGSPLGEKECGKLCWVIRNSSRQSITFHPGMPSMCTHICAHIHTCFPRHVIFKCLPNTTQLSYIHQIYINTRAFLSSHTDMASNGHTTYSQMIQGTTLNTVYSGGGIVVHTHTHTHTHPYLPTEKRKNKKHSPWWVSSKEFTYQCRGHRFNPWSRKIQPAPG